MVWLPRAQFLTLDEGMKGRITEDETIGILFARYGSARIEGIMATLFGDRLKTRGGAGFLSFADYLERVGVRYQPEALKQAKHAQRMEALQAGTAEAEAFLDDAHSLRHSPTADSIVAGLMPSSPANHTRPAKAPTS